MTKTHHKLRKKAKRTMIYFYVLVVLMSLFVVASYTWFTITRTPRVSNLNLYITSNPGLEMSLDKENWDLQLDFWEAVNATTPLDETNERPVLRPVTWSEENQCFYSAGYGIDGRLLNYRDWDALSDERNANKQNYEGYYIKAVFYVRSGQPAEVTLSPAVEVNEGVDGSGTYVRGVPVWNPGYYEMQYDEEGNELGEKLVGFGHENGGQGAENAIRIGFRITKLYAEENEENEVEYLPKEDEEPVFYIYEPNSDMHYDGLWQYVPTPSMDGTETLVDPERLILQTFSSWTEADPIENGVVIHTLGEFIDPPNIFSVKTGEMVQVELYVWLEGQDMDCLNSGSEAIIQANIQFAGTTEGQSGFTKIE